MVKMKVNTTVNPNPNKRKMNVEMENLKLYKVAETKRKIGKTRRIWMRKTSLRPR